MPRGGQTSLLVLQEHVAIEWTKSGQSVEIGENHGWIHEILTISTGVSVLQ